MAAASPPRQGTLARFSEPSCGHVQGDRKRWLFPNVTKIESNDWMILDIFDVCFHISKGIWKLLSEESYNCCQQTPRLNRKSTSNRFPLISEVSKSEPLVENASKPLAPHDICISAYMSTVDGMNRWMVLGGLSQ